MTPAQYMAAMVPLAQRFVGAIHGDGPDEARHVLDTLHAMPSPTGIRPADALMTVLAAMVDPTKTCTELLGWVTQQVPDAQPPHRHRPLLAAAPPIIERKAS